jgi:hypothetical protein
MAWRIDVGDCLDVMRGMPDASVDSIVTDPPAGVSFMGKNWDGDKGGRDQWIAWLTERLEQAFRLLKPGGHAVVWALPRTSHWTGMALEHAGFEVRDSIHHVFGDGFPKSLDVGKAIDKSAGAPRDVVGSRLVQDIRGGNFNAANRKSMTMPITAPATDAAKLWDGWGTALKPAHEVWWLARKPIAKKAVAAQVLATGTGAINIDGARVATAGLRPGRASTGLSAGPKSNIYSGDGLGGSRMVEDTAIGRWPANMVLTHSAACDESECAPSCPVKMLDENESGMANESPGVEAGGASRFLNVFEVDDGAAPFIYQAKPSQAERTEGLSYRRKVGQPLNSHPTVKSIALMRHFCRLVTPPNGTVLDPFAGSGTTIIAALRDQFSAIGIEAEAEYAEIARARIYGDAPLLNAVAQ